MDFLMLIHNEELIFFIFHGKVLRKTYPTKIVSHGKIRFSSILQVMYNLDGKTLFGHTL